MEEKNGIEDGLKKKADQHGTGCNQDRGFSAQQRRRVKVKLEDWSTPRSGLHKSLENQYCSRDSR